jgi:hypothetical protein
MSLDTSKTVESVTYNGVAFTLKGGGATTASEVSYTNANLEGVTNAQGALDALVGSKTQAETDIDTLSSTVSSMDAKVKKNTTDISTLASNQEAFTQDINTLNTQYTTLNEKAHTHSNKDVLDLFSKSTSFVRYNEKDIEEKVTINEEDNTTIELTNNTDFLRDEVASLTISFPGGLSLGTPFYRSSLSFKSGSTATAITYPTGIIWSGFDIKNGQFVPVAGKYYNIVFWRDYFGYNAVVRGVWV